MAAPITHIVLANKVFDEQFSGFSRKKFFIGTSFPDIRYLKVIKREETHFPDVSIEDVKAEESFRAGMRFHSLVDNLRERYMQSNGAYDLIQGSKYKAESLKLFEDELLYDEIRDWSEVISFMNELVDEERMFPVDEEDLVKWHKTLREYFSSKPSPSKRHHLGKVLGFTEEDVCEVERNIENMIVNDKLTRILVSVYGDFSRLLINDYE